MLCVSPVWKQSCCVEGNLRVPAHSGNCRSQGYRSDDHSIRKVKQVYCSEQSAARNPTQQFTYARRASPGSRRVSSRFARLSKQYESDPGSVPGRLLTRGQYPGVERTGVSTPTATSPNANKGRNSIRRLYPVLRLPPAAACLTPRLCDAFDDAPAGLLLDCACAAAVSLCSRCRPSDGISAFQSVTGGGSALTTYVSGWR